MPRSCSELNGNDNYNNNIDNGNATLLEFIWMFQKNWHLNALFSYMLTVVATLCHWSQWNKWVLKQFNYLILLCSTNSEVHFIANKCLICVVQFYFYILSRIFISWIVQELSSTGKNNLFDLMLCKFMSFLTSGYSQF